MLVKYHNSLLCEVKTISLSESCHAAKSNLLCRPLVLYFWSIVFVLFFVVLFVCLFLYLFYFFKIWQLLRSATHCLLNFVFNFYGRNRNLPVKCGWCIPLHSQKCLLLLLGVWAL